MKFETKDSGKRAEFASGMKRDSGDKPLYTEVYFPLVKRHAELMMRGAIKYDKGNWKKANSNEEWERAKESLLRHVNQYLMGEHDEDHLAGVLFNSHQCAMIEDKLDDKLIDDALDEIEPDGSVPVEVKDYHIGKFDPQIKLRPQWFASEKGVHHVDKSE